MWYKIIYYDSISDLYPYSIIKKQILPVFELYSPMYLFVRYRTVTAEK